MPGRAERVRRARRLAVVLAVVTVALVLALLTPAGRRLVAGRPAPAPGASPSATGGEAPVPEVGVSECGRSVPVARPGRLSLLCGATRSRLVVAEVEWGSWGQLNALGSALVVANDCVPTCAEGDDRSYAASVVLDRVVTTASGSQFSRATVVWSEPKPDRLPEPLQVALRVYPG